MEALTPAGAGVVEGFEAGVVEVSFEVLLFVLKEVVEDLLVEWSESFSMRCLEFLDLMSGVEDVDFKSGVEDVVDIKEVVEDLLVKWSERFSMGCLEFFDDKSGVEDVLEVLLLVLTDDLVDDWSISFSVSGVEAGVDDTLLLVLAGLEEVWDEWSASFSIVGVEPLDLKPGVTELAVGVMFLFLSDLGLGVASGISRALSGFGVGILGVVLTKDPLAFLILKDFGCGEGLSVDVCESFLAAFGVIEGLALFEGLGVFEGFSLFDDLGVFDAFSVGFAVDVVDGAFVIVAEDFEEGWLCLLQLQDNKGISKYLYEYLCNILELS